MKDKIQDFERLSAFPECPTVFRNKYGRVVTVGMYAIVVEMQVIGLNTRVLSLVAEVQEQEGHRPRHLSTVHSC